MNSPSSLVAEFEKRQDQAQQTGKRGANRLADVLARYAGAKAQLRIGQKTELVELTTPESSDNEIKRFPVYHDKMSDMRSLFSALPIE